MPTVAATTIYTDQLVNGDTTGVQIECYVRQEEAIAFRAALRISMGVLFHPQTVHPLAWASSTGEISRGDLAAGRCPSAELTKVQKAEWF